MEARADDSVIERSGGFCSSIRRIPARAQRSLLAGVFPLLIALAGCTMTETLTSLKVAPPPDTGPVEMAVIAEPRTARQDGQTILGLVVQVILLDPAGHPRPADGGMSFAIYRDDAANAQKIEADRTWKFSADQVKQSAVEIPLGVVHNFWLPLSGPLAQVPKIKMLSVYQAPDASPLTQWNHIHTAPKTMKIEQTTDIEELKAATAPAAAPTGSSQTP